MRTKGVLVKMFSGAAGVPVDAPLKRKTSIFRRLLSDATANSACLVITLVACEPSAVEDSVAIDLAEQRGPDGQSCGRGLAVLMTDYVSTSIGIVDFAGETKSSTFISSSSADARLNAPLGGDVAFPSAQAKEELVLIDRFPASVLTFVSLTTGKVRGQLDVGQDFAANPQDYLELDKKRALVSRYDSNPRPDAGPLERGDDILVIDRERLQILSSIDLSGVRTPGFLARPGQMLAVRDRVLVSVSGHDARFSDAGAGRIVAVDPERGTVTQVIPLEGVKNCGGLALSPDQTQVAVSCSGLVNGADEPAPADSAIVVLRFVERPGAEWTLEEAGRYGADAFELGPFSPHLAYAADDQLLVGTYGAVEGADAGRPDRALLIDLESEKMVQLLQSDTSAFTLGQIQCVPECSLCFVADASVGKVHRLDFARSTPPEISLIAVQNDIGLPPRLLARL